MNLDDLAERIRAQREKRGLRQNDLASALQVSLRAGSKWERAEAISFDPVFPPISNLPRGLPDGVS